MKPHKCPVCNGTALVSVPPGVAGDQGSFTFNGMGPWQCRSCVNGIVWEMDLDVPPITTICYHEWGDYGAAGRYCKRCGEKDKTL